MCAGLYGFLLSRPSGGVQASGRHHPGELGACGYGYRLGFLVHGVVVFTWPPEQPGCSDWGTSWDELLITCRSFWTQSEAKLERVALSLRSSDSTSLPPSVSPPHSCCWRHSGATLWSKCVRQFHLSKHWGCLHLMTPAVKRLLAELLVFIIVMSVLQFVVSSK